ncbi:MAG: PAS domain S-box protein, partial [Methanobacteriota archaeon]
MTEKILVLYVDDEIDLLNLGKIYLERIGDFQVIPVPGATEAIALLKENLFDIIISDYQMPGMDGIAFLKYLKAKGNSTPFILFTGRGREEIVIEALNNGADFYLQKGGEQKSQFAELSNKIQTAVSRRRTEQNLVRKNLELQAAYEQIAATEEELRINLNKLSRQEQVLRENEEKFRAMVETIPVAASLSVGVEQKCEYINPKFVSLFGYSLEDIPTVEQWWPLAFPDEQYRDQISKEWTQRVQRAIDSQSPIEPMEVVVTCKDGSKKHISWDFITLGEKNYACGLDLTERRRTEEILKLQTTTLSVLNDIITSANRAADLPQLLENILDKLLHLMDFDAGGIYLVDHSTRTADVVQSKNLPPDLLAEIKTISIDKKPYDTLFVHNKPIITDNYAQIAPERSKRYGFLSIASIPLLSKEKTIGALNIVSTRRHVIDNEEKQTLISIGRELGSTIERMRTEEELLRRNEELHTAFEEITSTEEELRANIDELTRQELELRESKRELSDIINLLPDATMVINLEGTVVAWNRAIEEMTGIPSEHMIGKGNYEYALPFYHKRRPILVDLILHDNPVVAQKYPALSRKGSYLYSEIFTPYFNNGKGAYLWFTASPLYDTSGNLKGGIESIRDISDRKQAEELLAESERKYRNVVEDQTELICRFLPDGTHIFVNDAYCRYFDMKREDIIGHRFKPVLHPDDREIVSRHMASLTQEHPVANVDQRIIMSDGSIKWQRWSDRAIFDNNGILKEYQSVGRDITEYKQTEHALASANKNMSLLSSITRHDINNQLTSLMGYLEILENLPFNTSHNDYLLKISTAAQRISSMIKFTKEYEDIGIYAPTWQNCHTLVEIAAKQAPLGQITIENDLPTDTEIFADPLIVKVCYNLIDNAVRYGGKITTIRFSVMIRKGDYIMICEDDGDGLLIEEKEKIFERGFGKNTGLGLFLVREILAITGLRIRECGVPGK